MKNKIILLVVLVIVLLVVGYFFKPQMTTVSPADTTPQNSAGKINIDEVCRGALIYMSFPDAASADAFVTECKEGKHPEVIEQYKAQFNLDGALI